jgi:DEAD/DEAH box helicase domain-containing protein
VIGEIDLYAAPTLIHEDAIYLHQGESYFIEKLDWEKRQAYARLCKPDYFTDGEEKVNFQILSRERSISFAEFAHRPDVALPESRATAGPLFEINFGEIALRKQAVLFKKIKMFTHENIGWGKITLPEIQMHTQAMWISFAGEWFQAKVPHSIQGPAISALAHLLGLMAPGFVLCDPSDLKARGFVRSPFEEKPIILFYDSYPGGIALAQRLFHLVPDLFHAGLDVIHRCTCESGCPSCIGPVEMLLLTQIKEDKSYGENSLDLENKDFSRIKIICAEILTALLKSYQLQAIEKPMLEVERFSPGKN